MLVHVAVVQSLSWLARIPLRDTLQFIYSRVDWNLSSFQILSMVNSVTLNILVHALIHMWEYTFVLDTYE